MKSPTIEDAFESSHTLLVGICIGVLYIWVPVAPPGTTKALPLESLNVLSVAFTLFGAIIPLTTRSLASILLIASDISISNLPLFSILEPSKTEPTILVSNGVFVPKNIAESIDFVKASDIPCFISSITLITESSYFSFVKGIITASFLASSSGYSHPCIEVCISSPSSVQ